MGDPSALASLFSSALLNALVVSAPVILAVVAAGVVAGLLQSATRLEEPSLGYAVRLGAAVAVLTLAGGWMLAKVVQLAQTLWTGI